MWILALAKNLDPEKVNCQLAVTREYQDQNLEVYNKFSNLNLKAHKIKMKGRFDPKVFLKLFRLIKQKNIDIIHTHGYKSDIIGFIAARLAGIKCVATPHGFENIKDFKLQMFISLGCFVLKHFDRVAPLSEELESDMHRLKVNSNKIRMIKNGVDLHEIESEREKTTQPLYKNADEKIIGYVGQIAYRKNISDLIKTFDLLYNEHKNIRLLLVGDGPMRKELEKMASTLKSSAKIKFLGYRPDRLTIMKEFDLFSMTSYLEGIPRCMMEAMSMQIPVAAYEIPGVDKLIINEKTGLMAEFGQVENLKKCWEQLLFDNEFASKIAINGRMHIVQYFSAKRMADEYTQLYDEVRRNNARHIGSI